ncbi:hypothetical protein ACDI16_04275 [Oceanobacillus caeni]|uniref:hypothetical protein n=1 Tax=Virgibacillus sp. SK37 TaxID=403957 RepID=UPI001443A5DE|nr:hypothetical protein [Virgibacillus sp. SK37]
MVIAFQVILFIILLITFFGSIGSTEKDQRLQMTSINIASIAALLGTFVLL